MSLPVNVTVTREELLAFQRKSFMGMIRPMPPEGSVSECCGAEVVAVSHAAGPVPTCAGCRQGTVGAEERARPRACSQCWWHVDLAEWRNCGNEFCPRWEAMRVLNAQETAELDLRPRRDLLPRVRRVSA